jgi:hypothetical protein
MVFSLVHDIKVTKSHQNLLPTQTVIVAHISYDVLIKKDLIKILDRSNFMPVSV